MQYQFKLKFNFTGGIISPGDLQKILHAAHLSGVKEVSFGLRQQLLIVVPNDDLIKMQELLAKTGLPFELEKNDFPNIISSYPAEEVFIGKTWLGEGVYKDIFDAFTYTPKLKINLSNNQQSFTPLLTGNINWVASDAPHFWHLLIRFPKTNIICEWSELVYTNDVAAVSKKMETLILADSVSNTPDATGKGLQLFEQLKKSGHFNTQPAPAKVALPAFMLPYYEGFNVSNDKYWLGIYRRNEMFNVRFLLDVCQLCLQTKIGQLCSTPWKSLIIKGIDKKDRNLWDNILGKHQINVRHAANELNFQVEDNCSEGVRLKEYLLRFLNREDVRSFGICIGIKTRQKSEVFSSILVKRKPLITIAGVELFYVYDILCSKDYNPNERTGTVFSKNILKVNLPEKLRSAIVSYYQHKEKGLAQNIKQAAAKETQATIQVEKAVHQCPTCFTVYDEAYGDEDTNIPAGTAFEQLPESWCCPLCETEKLHFTSIPLAHLYGAVHV